jgi:hypothetical protein
MIESGLTIFSRKTEKTNQWCLFILKELYLFSTNYFVDYLVRYQFGSRNEVIIGS